MNFEDLNIIWDEEKTRPVYTLNEEALHRMVEQRAASFRTKIFWKDCIELGVSALLVILFLSHALATARGGGGALSLLSVSHIMMALGLAFAGAYVVVTRLRQKRRESGFEDTVQGNLRQLISNVDCQGRLLGRMAWWSILPVVPGVVLFIVATSEKGPIGPWSRGFVIFLVFGFIFWLNRRAVRKNLLPQKREIESLLSKLENG